MNDRCANTRRFPSAAWHKSMPRAARTAESVAGRATLVDFTVAPAWYGCRRLALGSAPRSGRRRCRKASHPASARSSRSRKSAIPFELMREELEAVGRGATPIQISTPVRKRGQVRRDRRRPRAVFQGYAAGRHRGIFPACGDQRLVIPDKFEAIRTIVAEATHTAAQRPAVNWSVRNRCSAPRCYTGLTRSTSRGYPSSIMCASCSTDPSSGRPSSDWRSRAQSSRRRLRADRRQDFSIGYLDHTSSSCFVAYLQESFTFRVLISGSGQLPLVYATQAS